jgi:hypothetical protein
VDLGDHALLVRCELATRDVLEIRFRSIEHLIGSIPLIRGLTAGSASSQLDARF